MTALLALALLAAPALGADKPASTKASFLRAVRAHIKSRQENGVLRVSDDATDRVWPLKLIGLRRDRVAPARDGSFHTCADFLTVDGDHQVDVDFSARRSTASWVVEPERIHRVDGKARFLYNDRGERVPAQ